MVKQGGKLASAAALAALLAGCGQDDLVLQGQRLDVRDVLEGSEPRVSGAVANSQPINLGAPQMNADWAQRGGNARHAPPHAALSAQPKLVWSARLTEGSSRRSRIAAAPVVAGGRVFALDAGMVVSAVSTAGAPLWQADLTPARDRGAKVSGGGLASDGNMVFANTGYGEILGLNASTGQILWRQELSSPAQGAPAVEKGRVYTTARNGAVWALDAKDGKVIWQGVGTPAATGYLGTAAPTITERSVVFPSVAGDMLAIMKESGGNRMWQSSLAGKRLGAAYAAVAQDITGDAAYVGGTLYAGTASGRTVALDAGDGTMLWSADEGALGPVTVAGGSVFVVSDEARLARINAANGQVIWSVELPYFVAEKVKKRKTITAHYGPVLAGGRLWLASSDGLLRGFAAENGQETYRVDIPGGAAAQPAVAGGTMYVVSADGELLAFR